MKIEEIANWKADYGWIYSSEKRTDDGVSRMAIKYIPNWLAIIRHYEEWQDDIAKWEQFGYIEIYTPQGRIKMFRVEDISFEGLKRVATRLLNEMRKENLKDKIRKEMVK